MKIFISKNNSCNLSYYDNLIYNQMQLFEQVVNDPHDADILIFAGTCACTEQTIMDDLLYYSDILSQKKEGATTFLTGCLAREFKKGKCSDISSWLHNNFDYIVPPQQVGLLLEKILGSRSFMSSNDIGAYFIDEEENAASIYMTTGCLNNCSFCKATYQKMPLYSMPIEEVIALIDMFDEEKFTKLYLKGLNICQYGYDLYKEPKLSIVIDHLEKTKNIKKVNLIGFSYSDAIKNNLQIPIGNSSKINIISGSLESGSPRLLKLIRKDFTVEQVVNFVNTIQKKKHRQLVLNIMAGFPTETYDDILLTLNALRKIKPSLVPICIYCDSQFSDSHQYEQLSEEKKKEHARIYSKVLKHYGCENFIVKANM